MGMGRGGASPVKHPESATLLQVRAEPGLACGGGSARPLCCWQCRLSSGETMPCSCLLQAQATGQPAHSHWHGPPGPLLATAATPCALVAPQMPQPHTAPVPAAGRTHEARLRGCWLPPGNLQMAENRAFVRYTRNKTDLQPWPGRGNAHRPQAATGHGEQQFLRAAG